MITLATLAQATEQQVFDQVVKHLLAQGVRSKKGDFTENVCMYRGPAGLKCAAGCLIGDDEYTEAMDNNHAGTSWDGLMSRGEVPKEHGTMIQNMQTIHDNGPPEGWERALSDYAKDNYLEFNNE